MKTTNLALTLIALISLPGISNASQSLPLCFNEVARAAQSAYEQTLVERANGRSIESRIWGVQESYSSEGGEVEFMQYQVSGAAFLGGNVTGGYRCDFKGSVRVRFGTCELLSTDLKPANEYASCLMLK